MDNTISYTRRREDSAVYKVTIRKQLTAIQMRSVKGHLYNNPYYEWEEDKQISPWGRLVHALWSK